MNKELRNYTLITLLSVIAVHIYIITNSSEINLTSQLLLGAVALFTWIFPAIKMGKLKKTAYLPYIMHVITYLIVNISFWVHAFALYISNAADNEGELILSGEWMGFVLAMPLFWGFGLLIHTSGAYFTKGFENVNLK